MFGSECADQRFEPGLGGGAGHEQAFLRIMRRTEGTDRDETRPGRCATSGITALARAKLPSVMAPPGGFEIIGPRIRQRAARA